MAKKEKKRWFGLEVLGCYYRSLGSPTVVTLFKGIFQVDVPNFINLRIFEGKFHTCRSIDLSWSGYALSQINGQKNPLIPHESILIRSSSRGWRAIQKEKDLFTSEYIEIHGKMSFMYKEPLTFVGFKLLSW